MMSAATIFYRVVWAILFLQFNPIASNHNIPTFFIDPEVLKIFQPRILSCLEFVQSGARSELLFSLLERELQSLPAISASDFFRSHEIISHLFFTKPNNPYRRLNYEEAEFEYVPLLPFAWRSSNSKFKDAKNLCTYSQLILDILSCAKYLQQRDTARKSNHTLPRFTVASTYNMRTQMGTGMPTQVRRGAAWTTVSNFVMDLSIGHYERWPQCPDLVI